PTTEFRQAGKSLASLESLWLCRLARSPRQPTWEEPDQDNPCSSACLCKRNPGRTRCPVYCKRLLHRWYGTEDRVLCKTRAQQPREHVHTQNSVYDRAIFQSSCH